MSEVATESTVSTDNGENVSPLRGKATQFGTVKIEKIDLAGIEQVDGSTITDLAAASAAFDAAYPALERWVESDRTGRGATADYCEASFLLRTFCRNNTGGIDWAGKTEAYKVLWKNRLDSMMSVAKMEKSERDRFAAAVRGYNRDNDALRRFMARWLAENDNSGKLKLNEQPDGTFKPNAALVKSMQAQAGAQKSAGPEHKVLQGFEPATYVQVGDTVGQKKAAKPRSTGTAQAGSNEPPAQFEQLRKAVAKTATTEDGKTVPTVAPLKTADEVFHLVTSAAVALFGDGDGAFPFLSWEGYNREELAARWSAVGKLATAIGAGIKNPENVKRETLAGLYWNPGEGK